MFRFVRRSAIIGLLFFAFVSYWPAVNKDHSGPAKIIDSITIAIKGEQYRFYGVTKSDQRCDQEAIAALAEFLKGRTVSCAVRQKIGRDNEKRFVSVCYAGRDDVGAWMVRNGWALADRDANRLYNYTQDESMARFLGKGIWNRTQPPDTRCR